MVKGEIKTIKNQDARQICFSKRHQSLFKKACELTILYGAMVCSVIFSATSRPFSFGHPSIDEVTNRFLNCVARDGPASSGAGQDNSGAVVTDTVNMLNMEHSEMQMSLESEKEKMEILQEATDKEMGEPMMQWLNANILEVGIEELQVLQKWLEAIHGVDKEKEEQIMVEPSQTKESVPQPPMDIASTSQHQSGEHIWANPMDFTAPSSRNEFIDGFEVNYALLSGSVDGVNGSRNFPNN